MWSFAGDVAVGSFDEEEVNVMQVKDGATQEGLVLEMHAGAQKQRDGDASPGMFKRHEHENAGRAGGTSGGAGEQ